MFDQISPESKGAWIVHHGNQISMSQFAPGDYPVLDAASKITKLLSKMAVSENSELTMEQVKAVARISGINPVVELPFFLQTLEERRLIERNGVAVTVLGVTNRAVLGQSAQLFDDLGASAEEKASIEIAELTSREPIDSKSITEYVSDTYRFARSKAGSFVDGACHIGFVDAEGVGEARLLFNGNLFRR